MTTELEQEFYDTFGIEQKVKTIPCYGGHKIVELEPYPEITAEKLLEMICILGNGKDGSKNLNLYTANEDEWFAVLKDQYNSAYCAAIDKDFKNAILKLCIYRADIKDFKNQIQQLFNKDDTHKSTMLNIITDDKY